MYALQTVLYYMLLYAEILVELLLFLHVLFLLVHLPLINLLNHTLNIDNLVSLSVVVVSGHT